MNALDTKTIDRALHLLAERLELADAGPYQLVVCGGAALIACAFASRPTTRDVDVVALLDASNHLKTPEPLPPELLEEAEHVRNFLDLPENWLNNGPSKEPGGLFQVGLPDGLVERLTRKEYGRYLTVHFVGRLDQIHFKVFAAVDSGPGRHTEDLLALNPTPDEIKMASTWAMTHDPSPGFRAVLLSMIQQLGFGDVAERI